MHSAGFDKAISAIKYPKTDRHRDLPTDWYVNKRSALVV